MTKKSIFPFLAFIMLALVLVACGGSSESTTAGGDAAAGEDLFSELLIGSQPGCGTCHSLTPDEVIVGPSIAGVGSRAGSRVDGQSAEEYLRTSILNPDAYVVEGFQPGVMVQVWEEELSDEQVDDLVAYLLTLK